MLPLRLKIPQRQRPCDWLFAYSHPGRWGNKSEPISHPRLLCPLGTTQVPPARRAILKIYSPVRFPNVASSDYKQMRVPMLRFCHRTKWTATIVQNAPEAAVAGIPKTHSENAAYRPKRRSRQSEPLPRRASQIFRAFGSQVQRIDVVDSVRNVLSNYLTSRNAWLGVSRAIFHLISWRCRPQPCGPFVNWIDAAA
jgi:hypothetical protein